MCTDTEEYLDLKEKYNAFRDGINTGKNNFEEFRKCAMEACKYEQKYGKEDPEILYMIGDYYFIEKEFQRSLEYFKQAYEINKEESRGLLAIGHCLFKLEKIDEAQKILEDYCKVEKEHGFALTLLGCIHYYKNELILAKKYFIKSRGYDVNKSNRYIKKIDRELKCGIVNKKKKLENNGIHIKSKGILSWIYSGLGQKFIEIMIYVGVIGWMLCSGIFKLLLFLPSVIYRKIRGIDFKKIERVCDFIGLKEGSVITIELKDKYTTQFYLLHHKNGGVAKKYEILEENEIDEQNLWQQVIGQLNYSLVEENDLFIFFDKKLSQVDQHRASKHKLKLLNIEMSICQKIVDTIEDGNIIKINKIFIRL